MSRAQEEPRWTLGSTEYTLWAAVTRWWGRTTDGQTRHKTHTHTHMLTVVYEQGMFEGETRPFSGHRIVVQGQQVKKKQEEVLGHRRLSCQNQREQSMTHTNLIYGRRVLGNSTSYKAACVSYRTATYAVTYVFLQTTSPMSCCIALLVIL